MDELFRTLHRILSIAGVPVLAKHNWDSNIWMFRQIFNFIVGVFCFIFTTGFVVVNVSDPVLCIEGALIWITGMIMSITLGVCLYFRKAFRNFLDEMAFKDGMLEMPLIRFTLHTPQDTPKLTELRNLVTDSQEKLLKYTNILFKTYASSVFTCATLYLINPIYQMITAEDESVRIIGFEMWFPWSLQNMTVYIMSLIYNIYSAYLCCIAYSTFQSIIILLVGQLIRQLRILSFILLHMNELVLEITGGVQDNIWQAYCTLVLSQCVNHYVKVKKFSNRLNVICQPFYLALILVGIMLVCVCSVKIATSNKFSLDTMKYYFHELCYIIIVLGFCLLGQQVLNECEVLERVITEKWYIFNKNHRTNVIIFHMALGQGMPIYIFGTIPLSLPTFTWFIKTGMSFFTLVMSVLEEENY